MKKIVCTVIVLTLILCTALSVAAQNGITPFWVHTDDVTLSITYSGNNATCKVTIYGASGTAKITDCNVYLKDSSGKTIDSWLNNSATGDTLYFQKTAAGVSSGNSYTLSFTATVHRNGATENIDGSTTKKYS